MGASRKRVDRDNGIQRGDAGRDPKRFGTRSGRSVVNGRYEHYLNAAAEPPDEETFSDGVTFF